MLYFKRKEHLLYEIYDINERLLEFCKRLNQFANNSEFFDYSYNSYALYGIYFDSEELFGNTIILHSPYRRLNSRKFGEYKMKDNVNNMDIPNLDAIDLYSNSAEFDILIRPYLLNLFEEIRYEKVDIYHYSYFTSRFLEECTTKHFGFLMNDFSKQNKRLINIANSDSVQTNLCNIDDESENDIDVFSFLNKGFIYK